MNTNVSVIESFLKLEENSSGNLISTGRRLISYQTTIAQWSEDFLSIIVNETYYSQTTSRHRNLLKRMNKHIPMIYVDGIARGEIDLRR